MAGLTAFLIGLGLARLGNGLEVLWVWLSIAVVVLAWRFLSRPVLLASIVLLGLVAGLWRGGMFMNYLHVYDGVYERQIILTGTAETDSVYGNKTQLSFDIGDITVSEPEEADLVGRIKVEGFGEPAVYRGDVVRVEGKLFPSRGSRQGRIGFAQLEVLGRSASPIETIRHGFVAGMQSALPEPHASFGLGLLIGQRNTLPNETTKMLSIVGLTHIIAVSGYNLTIIVRGVRRKLTWLSKYQSMVVILTLIGVFLLFTGFSASIVRATVVSVLSLLAWYYGRTFRPLLLLLIAAALTAGWYPLYLWSDIGWYLSFLAFFGIMIVAPLLAKRFSRFFKRQNGLRLLMLETMCAQVMTMPLIMYIFKEFSLVALVANLLVAPLVPLAMLVSMVAGLSGMLVPAIAGWFAWSARILLTYMLDIITLLSRVPHALVKRSLGLTSMLIIYVAVSLLAFVLWRKTTKKTAIITDIM